MPVGLIIILICVVFFFLLRKVNKNQKGIIGNETNQLK